jgi:hypothetical protein
MQQISEAEFDITIKQLSDLVPVEQTDGGHWAHGMMVANVTTAYLDEAEFLAANNTARMGMLRSSYCTCLTRIIEYAAQLLEQMAVEGANPQFKNLCELLTESFNAGHEVVAGYDGSNDG